MAKIEGFRQKTPDPAKRIERIIFYLHLNKKRKISVDLEIQRLHLNVMQANPPTLQEYAAMVRSILAESFAERLGPEDKRIPETMRVLETAVFRFIHPVHTLEALEKDTETHMRKPIRVILRVFPPE